VAPSQSASSSSGQVVDGVGLGADDHVVGAGHILGLLDALDFDDLLGDHGGLADLGLDQDVCHHHKQRPPWVMPPNVPGAYPSPR
jgi:hypothetical protein